MWRPRATDLALAALVGALFGLSPITSAHRVIPSIAGGCGFGLAFLGYRAYLKRTDASSHPALRFYPQVSSHPALRFDPLFAVAVLLLVALVLPTAVELYPWYTESIWRNAHGLFVPLLAFALARSALRENADEPARPSTWGFAVLLPGLLLVVADGATHTIPLGVLGAAITVAGASLLLLGTAWTRHLMPSIALLLFLMP